MSEHELRNDLLASIAGLFLLAVAAGAAAQSGDTRTMQVSAYVKGSCRFESTPNINFGDLDPAAASDKTQRVAVTFKCTKGVTYLLSVGNGLHAQGTRNRMKSTIGNEYIPYDITPRTQRGVGKGFSTTDTVDVEGAVKGTDYVNVRVGAYHDTVILSVQP